MSTRTKRRRRKRRRVRTRGREDLSVSLERGAHFTKWKTKVNHETRISPHRGCRKQRGRKIEGQRTKAGGGVSPQRCHKNQQKKNKKREKKRDHFLQSGRFVRECRQKTEDEVDDQNRRPRQPILSPKTLGKKVGSKRTSSGFLCPVVLVSGS